MIRFGRARRGELLRVAGIPARTSRTPSKLTDFGEFPGGNAHGGGDVRVGRHVGGGGDARGALLRLAGETRDESRDGERGDAESRSKIPPPRLPSSDEPSPPPSARKPPVEVTIPRSSRRRTRRSRAPKKRRASPISRGKSEARLRGVERFLLGGGDGGDDGDDGDDGGGGGSLPGSPRAHRRQRSWSPSPSTRNRRVDVDAGTVREPRGETSTRTRPTPLATGSTRRRGVRSSHRSNGSSDASIRDGRGGHFRGTRLERGSRG